MVTPIQSRHYLKNKQLTQKAKRLSLWETANITNHRQFKNVKHDIYN